MTVYLATGENVLCPNPFQLDKKGKDCTKHPNLVVSRYMVREPNGFVRLATDEEIIEAHKRVR